METKYLVTRLVESKYNSRKVFDKEQMAGLVASIKEKGIQVPLILRPTANGFEIVAGARRFRAAKELGLTEVPAICREMSDEEAREVQIIENLQRADLHPLEEAQAFGRLATEHKLSLSDVGLKVGKPERYVRQRMVLTNLIQPVAEVFKNNDLAIGVAFVVARETPEHQKEFVKEVLRERTYAPDEDDARRFFDRFHLDLAKAPFDTTDAKLVPQAGSCVTCPKRSGNNAMLFPEIKGGDTCTDATCFQEKQQAFVQIQVKANPKAVKLSAVRDYTNLKVVGTREWVPAGDKPCKDVKPGVVVQREEFGIYQKQNVPLGKTLEVCVNPKCKVHWPTQANESRTGASRGALTPAEKKRRAAERIAVKVDALAFNAMVAILRTKPKVIKVEDIRRVALSVCGDYSFKYQCNYLAPAFGLKAGEKGDSDSQAGAKGQDHLQKFLKTAKVEDCVAFLVASELTPTTGWQGNPRKSMRDAAKRFGVNVAKLEKEVLAAKTKAKVPAKKQGRSLAHSAKKHASKPQARAKKAA